MPRKEPVHNSGLPASGSLKNNYGSGTAQITARIVIHLRLFSREAELSVPGGDGSSSLSSSDTSPADGTALQVRPAFKIVVREALRA